MASEDAATVAGCVLIGLDIVTMAGRFYARWFTEAGFGWDDWTILIALLTGILPGALTIWSSNVSSTGPAAASNFNPDYVFTPDDVLYTKITFATTVLYYLSTCITKISILLLFHRIFAISRPFRRQIYVVQGIVVAFWFSATLADCLDCIPLEWNWLNGNADPRHCINYNIFWMATGILESVIDLIILVLPFRMIFKLHMDRSKKFGLAGVFLLGGFILFSGVAKVVLSYVPNSREPNFQQGALWTTVHFYTGIICANLPPLRPLLGRIVNMGSGSWSRLSNLGRRFYSLGSGSLFTHRGTANRSQTRDKREDHHHRTADVEVGRVDYELMMYGRDGQTMNDRVTLVKPSAE